ncbi:MAG: hypothetical protein KUG73_00460, partial [Pseudomonadales bacterium]|nr:hypothetical protein [Pseudomonadales bacterium]
FLVGHFEGRPTLLGKMCTFLMIVQGLMVLSSLALFEVPMTLLNAGNLIVAILCVLSGGQYVFLGVTEFKAVKAKQR